MSDLFRVIALGKHEDIPKKIERGLRIITRSKQNHWSNDYFEPEIAVLKICEILEDKKPNADVLTFSPSHDGSYGPAQEFAKLLAVLWNISIDELIIRKKPIISAYSATRRPNVEEQKSTMAINRIGASKNKRIAIVDNVISTGATILASISVLSDEGYNVVGINCLTIEEKMFNRVSFSKNLNMPNVHFEYIYK